jgi:AraC-like DNA-binding protein
LELSAFRLKSCALTRSASAVFTSPKMSTVRASSRLSLTREPRRAPLSLAALRSGSGISQLCGWTGGRAISGRLALLAGRLAAKAVGLSRAAFARRFARALGVSPIAYLAELRLARAAQRLSECDHSLAEVATEVGYESEFAFSRAFKRRYGVPPAAYRRLRATSAPGCLALAA